MKVAKKNRQNQAAQVENQQYNAEFAEETAAGNAAKAAQKQQQNNQK